MNTTKSSEDMETQEEHLEFSDRGPWSNKWHPTWGKTEQKEQDAASQADKPAHTSSSGTKARFDEDHR